MRSLVLALAAAVMLAGCAPSFELASKEEMDHTFKLPFTGVKKDVLYAAVMEWTTLYFNQSTLGVPVPPIAYHDKGDGTIIGVGYYENMLQPYRGTRVVRAKVYAKIYYRIKDEAVTVSFHIYNTEYGETKWLNEFMHQEYRKWTNDLTLFVYGRQ